MNATTVQIETEKEFNCTSDLIGQTFVNEDDDEFEVLTFAPKLDGNCRCLKVKEKGRQVFVHREDMPSLLRPVGYILDKFGIKITHPKITEPLPAGVAGVIFEGTPVCDLVDIKVPHQDYRHGIQTRWQMRETLYRPLRAGKTKSAMELEELIPPWGRLEEYQRLRLSVIASVLPSGCELRSVFLDEDALISEGWAVLPVQ